MKPNQDTQDELRRILKKIDQQKTESNPEGNPFFPGNLSVDEALELINSHTQRAVLEARIDEHTNHVHQFAKLSNRRYADYLVEREAHLKDNQEKG